jgi:hypothetical protein
LATNRGAETCARKSLENVHIIQGAIFYREVGENFPRCAIKRKKYLEAAFGLVSVSWPLHQAPPFYFAQNLFRPVKVYVQGRERNTRSGLGALDSKYRIFVFVLLPGISTCKCWRDVLLMESSPE